MRQARPRAENAEAGIPDDVRRARQISPSPAGREREGPVPKEREGEGGCLRQKSVGHLAQAFPHPPNASRWVPPSPASGRGAIAALFAFFFAFAFSASAADISAPTQ